MCQNVATRKLLRRVSQNESMDDVLTVKLDDENLGHPGSVHLNFDSQKSKIYEDKLTKIAVFWE